MFYTAQKIPVIACDREKVIAAKGIAEKEIVNRRVTADLAGVMERRAVYAHGAGCDTPCFPVEGSERYAVACAPVIASGDIAGAILFLSADEAPGAAVSDMEIALVQSFAAYLGEQLSD